ncbi:MAG TPA: zinc-ribbon domain-containing protein [Thermoplasmata archaeon]|nr:zinc-ribbon domain-containing protein [Thermoplasmata archaeon]
MAAASCPSCGKPVAANMTFCSACGARLSAPGPGPAPAAGANATPAPTPAVAAPGVAHPAGQLPGRACGNCRTPMGHMGQVQFRTVGWVGTTSLIGDYGPGDVLRVFSLYYCQRCGKFDLYYPGT